MNVNNEQKEQVVLPEERMRALADLHINPTHKKGLDESPAFLLYLNYAVNSICDITGIDVNSTSKGVVANIKARGNEAVRKLANFFWLFNEDDPDRDFPNYAEQTLAIAKKIFELREYFAHLDENGVAPLTMDRDMYVLIAGLLAPRALQYSVKPGLRTAKLFKMKLIAVRDKENQIYEFTRRGLIFFICLALYREDAMEFTQCLEDMKLPACPRGADIMDTDCPCDCEDIAVCKPGVAKAFISMFTYYSVRRGRSVNLLEDDLNYMSFADISGYLNKAPSVSAAYLALEKENERLKTLADASHESEENKKFKYQIHKRARDRFLSFAAAYCEDFDHLKSVKFKRLDIPDPGKDIPPGRKRYFFGKEHDNRVHMDRHYQIEKNAIRFAWEPKEHYGPIHIDSLRSAISASAMKELLFAGFAGKKINDAVNNYFTAYHRILETVLNISDPDDITIDQGTILQDFSIVSGLDTSVLEEDLTPLYRFFPENFIRYFYGDDSLPSDKTLRTALLREFEARADHAVDFLNRLRTFNQWKQDLGKLREKDPEAKLPPPVCGKKDVLNPPRTCRISDSTLIAWVFRYFNLFLENDKKFRQLPPGEQHRGEIDHEYQFVHSLIGKYSLDPKGLTLYIQKKKLELLPALEKLNPVLARLRKEESKRRPPKTNRFGRPGFAKPSLAMLAEAAAMCYTDYFREKHDFWEKNTASSAKLQKTCRKFGIRTGMPLDRTSLLKTMLHIDLASWLKAYDCKTKANYENRSLDQAGHVISQIPFPNDFSQRIMLGGSKPEVTAFIRTQEGKNPVFDFNAAFRAMSTEIALRDFYDTAPLVAASLAVKKHQDISSLAGINHSLSPAELPPDFSQTALEKAIRSVKEIRNQDKLLIRIAYAYWQRFQSAGAFICSRKKNPPKTEIEQTPSIYDYFDASVLFKFKDSGDDRTIRIMPNDINRPILSQIHRAAPEIAKFMDPEGKSETFDFYEMLKAYRRIQMRDRAKRLAVIPLINAFASAVHIPSENYRSGDSEYNRNMEFSFYKKKFRGLTMEDFNRIVDMRNAIFHRGLNLQLGDAETILKKYVSVPVRKTVSKRNRSA